MAVVEYFRDHATNASADSALLKKPPISQDGADKNSFGLEQLDDVGAREFWTDYIGPKVGFVTIIHLKLLIFYSKVEFVRNNVFCSHLMS